MHIAKTKALISFAVIAKLICAFVFAYSFVYGADQRLLWCIGYASCLWVMSLTLHVLHSLGLVLKSEI